jgi:perosamine synthetase
VRFDRTAVGLDVPAPIFRDKVHQALQAEGVPCGRWQTIPVPGQRIFQVKVGYGKGCPWRCSGSEVTYDVTDYPVAQGFIDTQLYLFGVWPPNTPELMKQFAEACGKVMSQPEAVLKVGEAETGLIE